MFLYAYIYIYLHHLVNVMLNVFALIYLFKIINQCASRFYMFLVNLLKNSNLKQCVYLDLLSVGMRYLVMVHIICSSSTLFNFNFK